MTYNCPNCRLPLQQSTNQLGSFWTCGNCNGKAFALSLLRRCMESNDAKNLDLEIKKQKIPSARDCPICGYKLNQVYINHDQNQITLDICSLCQCVWFDKKEYEEISSLHAELSNIPSFSPKQKAEALVQISEIKLKEQLKENLQLNTPKGLEVIPAVLGYPIEQEQTPKNNLPWATWILAATIATFSLCCFKNLDTNIQYFGLIPSQAWRNFGITWVSSIFTHGGWMHLLGNLYFFLIFADNVEDYLGPSKFILLFFTAAFFGSTIHILSEPDSMVPMVGASGAISAIMVFYILEFPKAKLTIFLNIFFRFLELKLPAGMYLLLWLVLQARLLSNPSSGIAVFVHLGSALMGFILWLLWGKNKDPLITT